MSRGPWYRWLIGHGRSGRTFRAAAEHYGLGTPTALGETMLHTHNVISQTLIETGIPGVLLLISLWYLVFSRLLRLWRNETDPVNAGIAGALLSALLTLALLSQFDYTLWKIPGRLCWLITGLSMAWIATSAGSAAGSKADATASYGDQQ
jgi:O-antigen ligase